MLQVTTAVALVLTALLGAAATVSARTIEIVPSDANATCDEEFERVANTLVPGDELVLRGGIYTQSCRRAISVRGTAEQPIVIRAADGERPVLTRPQAANFDYAENNIEISATHLVLRGLIFRGGDTGVVLSGQHITLEDSEVAETGNNAIAFRGNTDSFVIRRNHVHHTGLRALAAGTTEGEGLYVGCNDAACIASNHLIEGNYIHHLRGTSDGGNDGIEVKPGSWGNVIRNNVIHDTTIGTRYPCIFVYGAGRALNVVEGNVLWNCGEAIQVVADAVVQNNVILHSDAGIVSYPHVQVASLENVTIVNNTLHGHRLCLELRWSSARNVVLANNAAYCPGRVAVIARGLARRGVTVAANFVEGEVRGTAIDGTAFVDGGAAADAFVDAAHRDLWPAPASPLRGAAATAFTPRLDFNQQPRALPSDVGAYGTGGLAANPGWDIKPRRKPLPATGAPDLAVVFTAGPAASAAAGGTLAVNDITRNIGTAEAPATSTRYYLSDDAARGGGDRRLVGRRAIPALAAGAESAGAASVRLPAIVAPGVYVLLACADDLTVAAETVEANNCLAAEGAITVTP